jgi:hypothetical protein
MVVELVSSEGQVARSTRTAFDGYYLIESIMPGSYVLRVSDESLNLKKLMQAERPSISITTSDFFIKDIQLLHEGAVPVVAVERAAVGPMPFVGPMQVGYILAAIEEMQQAWKKLTNFPPGVKSLMDAVNAAVRGE